jgi:hypothetical protein
MHGYPTLTNFLSNLQEVSFTCSQHRSKPQLASIRLQFIFFSPLDDIHTWEWHKWKQSWQGTNMKSISTVHPKLWCLVVFSALPPLCIEQHIWAHRLHNPHLKYREQQHVHWQLQNPSCVFQSKIHTISTGSKCSGIMWAHPHPLPNQRMCLKQTQTCIHWFQKKPHLVSKQILVNG